jgi:serine/threonine protein kinase
LVADKYEVVSRLGAGGFGTVYKVRHRFRRKYYAMKVPHPEYARDETFRRRFEREIEVMERFVHADAVMIRDSGLTQDGVPYYTMDFIDGESLKVSLRREGRFPVERATRVVRRVLRVLDVAHAQRIIHRDIKPDNILVTWHEGREAVKVLDFGVAKLLDLVGDASSLTGGMRVGTPKYMSPEQITGAAVDARSDIFSLGIVFYELVTGRHPFADVKDPIRVTGAILNASPRPPREVVASLPKAVNDCILWMLEKKPKRRPPSPRAVLKELGDEGGGAQKAAPAAALTLSATVPRCPAAPLVLRQETSLGERRSFLIFSEEVSFGRSNDSAKGIQNDLVLRCLPCRSPTLDPENWQRNLTISQRLGTLRPEDTAVVISPAPGVKFGLSVGDVRSFQPVRMQSDRFHLAFGDRALELDGHRVLRNLASGDRDLAFLAAGRPPGLRASAGAGYSNPACRIDCLHLQRASNWPLHEYFLVFRQVQVGSSANADLRLRCSGVEALHAAVIFEEGEAFLLAVGGSVLVRGLNGVAGAAAYGAFEASPGTLVALRPGLEIVLGKAQLRVEAAEESLFKTV